MMLGLSDLEDILKNMEKKGKFTQFISCCFDYKIESQIKEYYVQSIEGDIILYIYERRKTHNLYALEFTNGNCDVYMDKLYYKNIFVNTVYVNKCIELYNDLIDDKIVNYCKAMIVDNILEQKRILAKILPSDLIDIMYEKK